MDLSSRQSIGFSRLPDKLTFDSEEGRQVHIREINEMMD